MTNIIKRKSLFLASIFFVANLSYADLITDNIKFSDSAYDIQKKNLFKNGKATTVKNFELNLTATEFRAENFNFDKYNNTALNVHYFKDSFDITIYIFKNKYSLEGEKNKKIYFENIDEARMIYDDLFNKLTNKYGRNKYISKEPGLQGLPTWKLNNNYFLTIGYAGEKESYNVFIKYNDSKYKEYLEETDTKSKLNF